LEEDKRAGKGVEEEEHGEVEVIAAMVWRIKSFNYTFCPVFNHFPQFLTFAQSEWLQSVNF
jgi:hypothetical protein